MWLYAVTSEAPNKQHLEKPDHLQQHEADRTQETTQRRHLSEMRNRVSTNGFSRPHRH